MSNVSRHQRGIVQQPSREPSVPLYVLLLALAMLGVGCASEERKPVAESVTVDPARAGRIRFVVHGDPGLRKYPEINALALPAHEKIREGMRRHAADLLAERGLCTRGFVGPEVVLARENARLTSYFYVDCVQ